MLVESNLDHLRCSVVDQLGTLIVIRIFQELLTEVVSKGISHQLHDVCLGLEEDNFDALRISLLQLALQVTTAVLIFAESIYLALHVLKRDICKSGCLFTILKTALVNDSGLAVLNTRIPAIVLITTVTTLALIRLDLIIHLHMATHLSLATSSVLIVISAIVWRIPIGRYAGRADRSGQVRAEGS
jgi:hypothetical protein